jgi:hypothetical protein
VFGREELDKLAREKQAILAESGLNRLALQAELQNLRSVAARVSAAAHWPRKAGPLLLVLAPVAGFLLTRAFRRPDSWFNRLAAAAKWIGPLYSLWKRFFPGRTETEAGEPAV